MGCRGEHEFPAHGYSRAADDGEAVAVEAHDESPVGIEVTAFGGGSGFAALSQRLLRGTRGSTVREYRGQSLKERFWSDILLDTLCVAVLCGCASYGASGLKPGRSTLQDVRGAMGEPALQWV